MASSIPHHCLKCMKDGACGYHGVLVFRGGKAPTCKHNDPPGKPCHLEAERMVPVK